MAVIGITDVIKKGPGTKNQLSFIKLQIKKICYLLKKCKIHYLDEVRHPLIVLKKH